MHSFLIDSSQKSLYEAFLRGHGAGLMQSWEWGEFQASLEGRGRFWVVGVGDNRQEGNGVKLLGTALLVKQELPFGLCWLSVARGPVMGRITNGNGAEQKTSSEKSVVLIWRMLWGEILKLAKQERAVFVRVERPCDSPLRLEEEKGWRPAHAHYYPEWTREVDLKPPLEAILAQMKPKGRYNIKVAQKNGVTVRSTHQPEDVSAFYEILKETGGRDGFGIHGEEYYQKLVKAGQEGGWGILHVAEVERKIISALFVTFYGSTATYYYGASAHQYRATMAPYLLQWTAIQEAKQRGCAWYDFLGVAPPKTNDELRSTNSEWGQGNREKKESHPWDGITAFKEKFGGILVQYPPSMEFVVKPWWYGGIRLYKRLKKVYNLNCSYNLQI